MLAEPGLRADQVEMQNGDRYNGRVLSMSAQFRSPVRPGDKIVAHGRVRSIEPAEAVATLDVWVSVERDGAIDEPVRRGVARVRI